MTRLRDAEHVPHPCAHLVRRRARRLVHDCNAEADPFRDRPVLRPRPPFRVGHLVEDDEVAHPSTRAAIIVTISSGGRSRESITRSKIAVSPRSLPKIDRYRIPSDRLRARIARFPPSTVVLPPHALPVAPT